MDNRWLEWQYLIFELPLITATLLILVMSMGSFEFGEHDVDHDVDHDMDSGDSSFARGLSLFGIGRAPLSIVLVTLMTIWGFVGFWSNRALESIADLPIFYAWVSIAIAGFASVSMTRFVAGAVSKIMPKTETYATRHSDLIGKRGVVLHTLTDTSGTVRVRDKFGNILDIPCRVAPGQEKMNPDTPVVLLDYNVADNIYAAEIDQLPALR